MATVRNAADQIRPTDPSYDHDAFAVTPSDSALLRTPISAFTVGVTGAVAFRSAKGETITLPVCNAGTEYFCETSQILATGTTATGIIGIASKALR